MIRVAVVGYGYWGPNLARNFAETPGAELVAVCDTRASNLDSVRTRFPFAKCTTDFDEVCADPGINAVVIATPVSTHAPLALKALRAGKHVLVTKPIAATSADARAMVEEAEKLGLVLLVDHTFVYMGAVQRVGSLVRSGELGDLFYFDSVRVNLGLYQRDVSVLWDLAVHDLSIIGSWVDAEPRAVSCIASGHVKGHPQDVAYLTLLYDDDFIAHVNVNWLSPVKIRRTLLAGTKKMVVFDDLDPVEKIKVYDRGITHKPELVGTDLVPLAYRRTGDIWMPQFDLTEALRVEAEHFVRCVTEGERPLSDGRSGLRVVQILEAAEKSILDGGRAVPLERGR